MKHDKQRVPEHNYLRKIAFMAKTGALPRDVGFHQVSVYHDDWCGVWKQQRCNCDPDVRLKYSVPGNAN